MEMDMKSAILGVVIGVFGMIAMGATTNTASRWTYRVVSGSGNLPALGIDLNNAGGDGWEAVAAGESSNRSWVLLKRAD